LLLKTSFRFAPHFFDPSGCPISKFRVVFVLPTTGGEAERFSLTGKQEFFANRIRNELATVALIHEAIEIRQDFLRQAYMCPRRAHDDRTRSVA